MPAGERPRGRARRDAPAPKTRVLHRVLANVSRLPPDRVDLVDACCRGAKPKVDFEDTCLRPCFGQLAALRALAAELGITAALGRSRLGRLALFLVLARVVHRRSRLSSTRWAADQAVGPLLGLSRFDEDELYAALDWLESEQERIELARRRPPSTVSLYDVTSSHFEGQHNELAAHGCNRDGKRFKKQVVLGLLTNPAGDPVAVRVYRGNTADPKTVGTKVEEACDLVVPEGRGEADKEVVPDGGVAPDEPAPPAVPPAPRETCRVAKDEAEEEERRTVAPEPTPRDTRTVFGDGKPPPPARLPPRGWFQGFPERVRAVAEEVLEDAAAVVRNVVTEVKKEARETVERRLAEAEARRERKRRVDELLALVAWLDSIELRLTDVRDAARVLGLAASRAGKSDAIFDRAGRAANLALSKLSAPETALPFAVQSPEGHDVVLPWIARAAAVLESQIDIAGQILHVAEVHHALPESVLRNYGHRERLERDVGELREVRSVLDEVVGALPERRPWWQRVEQAYRSAAGATDAVSISIDRGGAVTVRIERRASIRGVPPLSLVHNGEASWVSAVVNDSQFDALYAENRQAVDEGAFDLVKAYATEAAVSVGVLAAFWAARMLYHAGRVGLSQTAAAVRRQAVSGRVGLGGTDGGRLGTGSSIAGNRIGQSRIDSLDNARAEGAHRSGTTRSRDPREGPLRVSGNAASLRVSPYCEWRLAVEVRPRPDS